MPFPPFLIIGNPENQRVEGFCHALAAAGEPAPRVLSHLALLDDLRHLERVPSTPHLVRLDAAGENAAVERALLKLGWEAARDSGATALSPAALDAMPVQRGEILCPRQHHLGLARYLEQLQAVFDARPAWRVLSPPRRVAELFDKRLCSQLYAARGLPVPDALPAVADVAGLRAAMQERGWPAVFVKLSSGSSASCLAYFHRGESAREVVHTTIRRLPQGWFNSLRVQRLDRTGDIEQVLGFLLREGSQVERAVPKARLGKGFFDLRVLVVDDEPAFTVVRQNSHPITNLHLGGWRGDLALLRAAVRDEAWAQAMTSCRAVWELHGCFHLGVDLLLEPSLEPHRVIEANAFGDLLPGLRRGGLDVYGWEIRAAQRRFGT